MIAGVIGVWVLSGAVFRTDAPRPETVSAQGGLELASVRATVSKSQPFIDEVIVRGRTEASRIVTLKAGTVGKISSLPVIEGTRVVEGDLSCQLALDTRAAEKSEAEAMVRQRLLEFEAAKELRSRGVRSETQEAAAQAAYESALAALARIELDIEHTQIVAPFDGVVDSIAVEVGDFMQMGAPCATIIDEDPFLVTGFVSESDVDRLDVGKPGWARLVSGQTIDGRVRYVSKRADPSTRMFEVELEVDNTDRSLRDGMTAEVHVPADKLAAHLVPPSVLVLNDAGDIGVRTVSSDNVVTFVPATVLKEGPGGMWLGGLPDQISIITVGQYYVTVGQVVEETFARGEPQSRRCSSAWLWCASAPS